MSPMISKESLKDGKYDEIFKSDIKENVERGVEERAKRKLTCDTENDLLDYSKKRKRKFFENDSSSCSSLSSMSDDYGTDSELIAINENEHLKIPCRCTMVNDYENIDDDNIKSIVICTRNSCTQNYPVTLKSRTTTMRIDEIINKITSISKLSNSNTNTKCLLNIAIATLKLIKKNQEFQIKLTELQSDTTNLLNSVLENPENHSIKEQLKFSVL
ncbi:hypothetical protein PVAND_011864 [Polypedilum vanderplanki]|uniref:Uncharacterized protein n=1 Tax=Polypedilum vanderplanki TaxID=319348 RepID=A0A9J6CLJ2_POLVA|nr:hypothetical protein PVAND_011864 [Polypedilum vanderplanki]